MDIDIVQFYNSFQKLIGKDAVSIALAVSGGVDSMCLAYLCKKWQDVSKIKIICLIVDHKLRIESTKEAHEVKENLEQSGMESVILTWNSIKPNGNIHSNARKARYALMTNYCINHNIKYLATAHNKNDQAETVLMRILRGTGVDGLCGIPQVQTMNGICIIRPMLQYFRSEIEATLSRAKWKWVIDPSNFSPKYERTYVRHILSEIEAHNHLIYARLNLLAKNATRMKVFLTQHTEHIYQNIVLHGELGEIILDREQFIALDYEIALRILVIILKNISSKCYPPRLENTELLYKAISSSNHFHKTLWGCEVVYKTKDILFYRELKQVESTKQLLPNISSCWDGRYNITVREENLSIGALGAHGLRDLKHLSKIQAGNAKVLYPTPAIFRNQELIYHPLLRIGNSAVIENFSKNICKS